MTVSIVACVVVLLWVALWMRSRFRRVPMLPRAREEHSTGSVETVHFPAKDGTQLEGWLFLPRHSPAPLVLMAPGLAGTKEGFLEPFAWEFVAQGLAVLAFDYRCFGGSDGMPRHWVDPLRHREDYEAALAFVRGTLASQGLVDAERIGVWGSSFSGGTAIVTAASDPSVRALVVQCPYLETPPALQPRGLAMLRYVLLTTLDLLRVLPPIYIPVFGRPGEWVFAPSQENPSVADFEGPLGAEFWRAMPKQLRGGWENRMLARMLAGLDGFVPMRDVSRVTCASMFVAAQRDDMVPVSYVERAFNSVKSAHKKLRVVDAGHFDLYAGSHAAENARAQAAFLAEHLRGCFSRP